MTGLDRPQEAASASAGAAPSVPEPAASVFGERLPLARAYAELLATDGVVRGLIGPRETPRIWDRHLLNCAVVAELIPAGAAVTDVGSGAGLPGLVLAILRDDLVVTLVDSMARRTDFLTAAVAELGLADRVEVFRGRAEESADAVPAADVVTSRAVAPLDRLSRWCLPLVEVGGRVLALKGESAAEETKTHAAAIRRAGGGPATVRRCGVGVITPPTTVVEITRVRPAAPDRRSRRRPGKRS